MFRQGPIPALVHGLLDYVVGAVFIAAPFVLGFEDDAAIAVALVAGVLVLVLGATTAWRTGLIRTVPVLAHAVMDLALSVVLIAAPFLFAFSDDGVALPFFLVAGVLLLLGSIATRWMSADSPPRAVSRTS